MSRRAIARAVSATVIGLGAVIPALALGAPAATAAPAPQLAAPLLEAPQQLDAYRARGSDHGYDWCGAGSSLVQLDALPEVAGRYLSAPGGVKDITWRRRLRPVHRFFVTRFNGRCHSCHVSCHAEGSG